jgi:site-specific DNA-cytosine methylase
MDNIQESLFGKTLSAHSTPTEVLTSGLSSTKWLKQGRWQSNGQSWMRNIGFPKDVNVCSPSLSSILQSPTDVQTRYYLSPKACQGILRRANRRGKVLPERLQKALEQMVQSSTPSAQKTYHHGGITNQDVSSGHMVVEGAEWWNGGQIADSLTTTSNDQRMPDKQRFQAVVEQNIVGALAARDYKGVGNQYVAENKCVVEPMIAIGIQGNVIGRQDHNGPAGKGHTEEGEPMFTLTSTDIHAVASTMAVRRLTPLECERLMGWPDNHTLTKADGTTQADTHRYKQCGNGVASPVAQWIAKHILAI